ncbi:MAG TPA: alginate export family protein [Fimbriimonas sp.]
MPLFTLPPIVLDQIRPYVEIRERFERRENRDLNENTADNRSDLLSRFRVGATFSIAPSVTGELQYQYAHELIWTVPANASTDHSDVSLGYLRHQADGETLTLGRQKIALGSQRLIGPLEWSNVARSFDGVRFQTKNLDLWAAGVGVGFPRPRDARLAGAGYTSRYGQTTLLAKWDRLAAGDQAIFTLDHLVSRNLREWNLEFEGALQAGDNAGRRQEAWALHARAGYRRIPNVTLYVEVNAASGGADEDVVRTFDNLYPTNHPFYGIMDLQGWKNMNEIALGVDYKPRADVTLKASWHKFTLRDSSDAWYGAGGGPNRFGANLFVDPTGRSGRDTGEEFDLEGVWNAAKSLTLSGGIAVFEPGAFVKNVSGSSDRQVWGFLQAQYRF